MKKLLLIFMAMLFISGLVINRDTTYVKAGDFQIPYKPLGEYRGDTLNYLVDNFVKHQQYYKNKELKILLDKLELPVGYYSAVGGGNIEKGERPTCTGIHLYFWKFPNNKIYRGQTIPKANAYPCMLGIGFKNSFTWEKAADLLGKYGMGFQDSTTIKYYSSQVIDTVYFVQGIKR
jgi:hypothetical protein